jgi:excisionase family DNA binding protein
MYDWRMDAALVIHAEPLLLTVDEAAGCLRISRSKFYKLMRDGAIPTLLMDGSRRVAKADLEAYVNQLREQAAAA